MSIIGLMLILMTTYIVIFSPYFKISPSQVIVEAMFKNDPSSPLAWR